MPILNADAKQLEWVAATFLSQDPVAIEEILAGADQHADNQARLNLPSRLIAKIFVFRLIFGGQAWSYAHDPDFAEVKGDQAFWQDVIDKFYNKYKGLGKWHKELMLEAIDKGRLVMPTGRVYTFKQENGEWPRTQILNYPVQGLGHDLMAIARVSLYKRMRKNKLKSLLISTVHDSIVSDCPSEEVEQMIQLHKEVFRDIPLNFKRLFGVEFNLPMRVELELGNTWGTTIEVQ
jgi:DNA polymerase-1